jgi:potassium efflux system protein
LLYGQRPLRQTTTQLGEQAARSNITSIVPTLRAFLTTGLIALLWPGLLGYVGMRLAISENVSAFVRAIGAGLQATAIVFATFELFRQVLRRRGLGEAHFQWNEDILRLARRTTFWFMACGLPCILVVTVTEAQASEAIKNSLGRVAYLAVLLALTACVHRVMRPAGGALDGFYSTAPQAWTSRLRRVWHLLALSVPLALGALAFGGYYYTALELGWRLILRVYLPSREVYLQVRHELHAAIAREFKQAGIEIAFPQRDIHIRSAELPTFVLEQSGQKGRTNQTNLSQRPEPQEHRN